MNQSIVNWESQSLRPYEDSERSISNQEDNWSQELTDISESTSGEIEANFAEELDNAGLDDSSLATGLALIATSATKVMSLWGWETLEVPDYNARLDAIKTAMKAKWHLSEQNKWAEKAKKHIKYILYQGK